MANGYFHLSDAFREEGHYDEALRAGHQALAMYEDLARADPRNVGAKKDVGGCIHKLAEALLARGDGRAAERQLERAIAIRRELAAQDTGSIEYRDDLADTLMLAGESLLASHQPLAAIERLDEARRIREPIVASRPQQVAVRAGWRRSTRTSVTRWSTPRAVPIHVRTSGVMPNAGIRGRSCSGRISAGATPCGRASRCGPLTCCGRLTSARERCGRPARVRSPCVASNQD